MGISGTLYILVFLLNSLLPGSGTWRGGKCTGGWNLHVPALFTLLSLVPFNAESNRTVKMSIEKSWDVRFCTVTAPAIVGIRHRKGDTALNWHVDKASWYPSGDLVRISCLLRDVYTDIDVVTVWSNYMSINQSPDALRRPEEDYKAPLAILREQGLNLQIQLLES